MKQCLCFTPGSDAQNASHYIASMIEVEHPCMQHISVRSCCMHTQARNKLLLLLSSIKLFDKLPTDSPFCNLLHQESRQPCDVTRHRHFCTTRVFVDSAALTLYKRLHNTQMQSSHALPASALDLTMQHGILQITLSTTPPGFRAVMWEIPHSSGVVPEHLLSTHSCTGLRWVSFRLTYQAC